MKQPQPGAVAPQLQTHYWIIRNAANGTVLAPYKGGDEPRLYKSEKSALNALKRITVCDTSTCAVEKIEIKVVP